MIHLTACQKRYHITSKKEHSRWSTLFCYMTADYRLLFLPLDNNISGYRSDKSEHDQCEVSSDHPDNAVWLPSTR